MNGNIAVAATATLSKVGEEVVELYTRTALVLNALDVTAKGYVVRTDPFQLSTTMNIPSAQRLPIEIDRVFKRDELVIKYTSVLLQSTCEDFVIRMVSLIDAGLEEIFEVALLTLEPALLANRRQSRIRGAWAMDDASRTEIARYLVDVAGLRAPPGNRSTVDMVFDRYSEIREVRHALVHFGGEIAPKHRIRLSELRNRLPEELRHGSLASAQFLQGARLNLRLGELLGVRKWAYETVLGYLREAFAHSVTQTRPAA